MRNFIIVVLLILIVAVIAAYNLNQEDKLKTTMEAQKAEQPAVQAAYVDPHSISTIDSAVMKKLKPKFKVKKDEFQGSAWYRPKAAPTYTNRNGIFCYFDAGQTFASNLRFRIQYLDDDWLFIEGYQFLIDGHTYNYIPDKVERDNGDGDIWEWTDEPVTGELKDIVMRIRDAKTVKIKLAGKQYFDTRTMSAQQITGIRETVDLYSAMGGTY